MHTCVYMYACSVYVSIPSISFTHSFINIFNVVVCVCCCFFKFCLLT